MPLVDEVLPELPKKPAPVTPTPQAYKNSVVNSSVTPIETIAQFIGGSNWTVDYYSQNAGAHEQLKPFDLTQLAAYQSYQRINKLVVKLQGALRPADDREGGRMGLTGSMIIPPTPGLIPNQYDMFVADIGEGQAGIFTITSVEKNTTNRSTAWNIEFKLQLPGNESNIKRLDAKVTEESFYDKDLLILGQNPLLKTPDYNALHDLKNYLREISTYWVSTNYSPEHRTFILPLQSVPIYDQYVVRAIMSIVSPESHRYLTGLTQYNCDDHRLEKATDIYQALIKCDPTLLYTAFRPWTAISTQILTPSYYQHSVRYSGIKGIVIPAVANQDADDFNLLAEWSVDHRLNVNGISDLDFYLNNFSCPADPTIPCEFENVPLPEQGTTAETTHQVDAGMDVPNIGLSGYVLPQRFYEGKVENATRFERAVWQMLRREPLDYQLIYQFCLKFRLWGRLEQFYYGPILICLIKASLRSLG